MRSIFQFFLVLTIFQLTISLENSPTDSLVQRYVTYLNERTESALNYEFPTDARMYEAADTNPIEYGEYDFIIIGAGSAGCAMANRLSEVREWKILLLEAGTYRNDVLTELPAYSPQDSFTTFDWGYKTIPQKHALYGAAERSSWIPKGKGAGGCSLISGVVSCRGNKLDYDRWSSMVNDPDWGYEKVLPYFLKLENFTQTNPYSPIDVDYHGFNGPLHITQGIPPDETTAAFLKGTEQFGYPLTDYNGEQQLGVSIKQLYTKNGKKVNSELAYLAPIVDRKNLEVLDMSYVVKIEVNETNKTATGVLFTRLNETYVAVARNRKEVIVSAGAIASPQILMLSGIGPREHLESLNIPIIQDLPVGKNYHDYVISFIPFSKNISSESQSLEESVRQLLNGEGPLTRSDRYDYIGWFQTPIEETVNYPDIEVQLAQYGSSPLIKSLIELQRKVPIFSR